MLSTLLKNFMTDKIIIGTAQFGLSYGITNNKKVNQRESHEILEYAKSKGIKFLDSAESYGNAHEIIGKYHYESDFKFEINTKLKTIGTQVDFDRKLDSLLKDLNVDKINTLMLHSSFEDVRLFEEAKSISSDRVKNFGCSIYNNSDLKFLNLDSLDCIQLPFNLLDNINHRKEILNLLKLNAIRVDVRSVFLQGLLSSPEKISNSKLTPLLMNLKELESKLDNTYSLKHYALCYPLMQNKIDKVIFGVDSLQQLKENLNFISKYEALLPFKNVIDSHQCSFTELLDPRNWL